MFKKKFPFRRRKENHDEDDGPSATALSQYSDSSPSRRHPWPSFVETSFSDRGPEPSGQDPLGLSVVHRPIGERSADVIFVHGLGGGSRKTWSHDRNPDLFWPLKFLSLEKGINEARILTFGYNSNFLPGSGRNKMSISEFAKELLLELKCSTDRSESGLEDLHMGEKPIILVAHSMGGLIVKRAYIRGQNDPAFANITKAISAIIFLSTPHRGSSLAETLNRILRVSFGTSPMQFISDLAPGSQTIQDLNEDFRHVAPNLDIVSFYETRPTPLAVFKKLKITVLEKDSSVLGYPGEISKPLDADHHGVCKYSSQSDPRYVTVRNVLKSLIEKLKTNDGLQEEKLAPIQPAKVDYSRYLHLSELPEADYNFFRDRWTPGTCTWIVDHEGFAGWINDLQSKPRVLWLHGNGASGKSILSSFVINHLVESGQACHYFFVRFTSEEKRGMSMMLRSLAYQLALSTPSYAEKLQKLEAAGADFSKANDRRIWQWLFQQTLLQLDSTTLARPLYLVIDGIDEAGQPASFVKLLSDLHLSSVPIRLLMVGRNTHEVSSALQKLAKQLDMDTIRIDGSPADFRVYIHQEMNLSGDASYKEQVISKLLDRAQGNFLWVHLAVQRINSCHTRLEIEEALTALPPGMELLYDRMAQSVEATVHPSNRHLCLAILCWATCSRRSLTVEELEDALGNDVEIVMLPRTIVELCGGFVTVDCEGRVALIHDTAREYLTDAAKGRSLRVGTRDANNMLLRRCLARLTDPALRSEINRGRPPALVEYATAAWPHHLSHSCAVCNQEMLEMVATFLKGPHVLTWVFVAAKSNQLEALVLASHHLSDLSIRLRRRQIEDGSVASHQTITLIEGWATDLAKIVGKFGHNLGQHPNAIYRLIPPFCPADSMVYRQFGRKEARALHISGYNSAWDDCLVRFSLPSGTVASTVITAGARVVLLSVTGRTSQIIIYNPTTFEELRRITHPERVSTIQSNTLGSMIISYGYSTSKVWDADTGECLKTIQNPPDHPRPHSIIFTERPNTIVVCGADRCIRTCSLDDDSTQWIVHARIDEEKLHDTIVNFPMCSALRPDGRMVAFGYRNHPLTVWELEPPMLLGQCYYVLTDLTGMATGERAWGDVFHVAWHPTSGEVFGLTQVGMLFRWDPLEEEPSVTVQTGGHCLAVNHDGSLVATGDVLGTIKVFATADFSKVYQLSSADPVLRLSFSADSRHLLDTRGSHSNVWEPNELVRLADVPDYIKDAQSKTGNLVNNSLLPEQKVIRVDRIVSLAGQLSGPLYCYGTENGVASLCERGRGMIFELARFSSCMPIRHVVWSGDGRLIALADLGGQLAVKRVTRAGEQGDNWQASPEFEIRLPMGDGNFITQLIFHPASTNLFVATPAKVFTIDVATRVVNESALENGPVGTFKMKWACHPTRPDVLLGFETTRVRLISWKDNLPTEVYTFSPPRPEGSSAISSPSAAHSPNGSTQANTETLERLISKHNSAEVMLQVLSTTSSGRTESQFLLFDFGTLQAGDDDGRLLPYTVLESDICSRIREPLAFLSRRRLVFIDVNRWICTWLLPSVFREGSGSSVMEAVGASTTMAAEQHYFLPSDWVTGDDARLCTVTPDGTLLCPGNGNVVAVQAAKLRT